MAMSSQAVQQVAQQHSPAQATFESARLPWHDAIGERFKDIGVTKTTWKVLCEAIWPSAKTTNSIVMALSYCQSRRLDPFKKVVHIVPVWDSKSKRYIETVWPSISEMRTTAFRTGCYAGCDETKFGPTIEKTFTDRVKEDDKWVKTSKTVSFPEWAQVTVYRMVSGQRVPFVGPKVYWLETYARMGRSEIPNDMWARRAHGQPEKCAEAGALRKAFPEELGNEYSAEEMEGQRFFHEMRDVTPGKPAITAAAAIAADIPDVMPNPVEEPAAAALAAAAKTGKPAAAPPAEPEPAKPVPAAQGTPIDDDDWPGPRK